MGGRGMSHCTVDVGHQASLATNSSNKWTSLVIQHGSTTDVSNFTALSNGTGTTNATATAAQFVLPTHNDTSVGGLVRFHVNLGDKERYLRLVKEADDATQSFTYDQVTFWNDPLTPASDLAAVNNTSVGYATVVS